MSNCTAAGDDEAGVLHEARQFVDVFPKETLEESWIDSLIAALNRFDEKNAVWDQDLQDFFCEPVDVECVIERVRVNDID